MVIFDQMNMKHEAKYDEVIKYLFYITCELKKKMMYMI